MSSLRQVKKNIRNFCGDILAECVLAGTLYSDADEKKLADAVLMTAKLQTETIRKLSISFDKSPRDFTNLSEYRKARRYYYRKAIASLDSIFLKEAESIIALMNKAIPEKHNDGK